MEDEMTIDKELMEFAATISDERDGMISDLFRLYYGVGRAVGAMSVMAERDSPAVSVAAKEIEADVKFYMDEVSTHVVLSDGEDGE